MQVSEISQDLAMLSQSSQDQTQAMDEGTPPEKHTSTGAALAANDGCLFSSPCSFQLQRSDQPCLLLSTLS